MQYEQNGAELYAEFYQNYTTYYLLQFAFIYAKDKEFGVYDLKAAFSALGKWNVWFPGKSGSVSDRMCRSASGRE